MSNTPGISPLTPDLEEIRHSDDSDYDEVTAPDDDPEIEKEVDEDEEEMRIRSGEIGVA